MQRTKIGGMRSRVHLVGSSTNGFGRHGSDADYCIVVDPNKEQILVMIVQLQLYI